MAVLLAVLVGGVAPAFAQPVLVRIKDFPAPFVQDGTIFTEDGKPTMAIILGSNAAAEDVRAAALIAMKIGSHLYYTRAPNIGDYRIPELVAEAYY
ncbi:MAG: hypothetical protein DRO06_04035, partial [Thermoproteota archaeon]